MLWLQPIAIGVVEDLWRHVLTVGHLELLIEDLGCYRLFGKMLGPSKLSLLVKPDEDLLSHVWVASVSTYEVIDVKALLVGTLFSRLYTHGLDIKYRPF